MGDPLENFSFSCSSMDKKRRCNSKENVKSKERKILLKEEDELKVVKAGKNEKEKKEETIMLFENDEIVEYIPRYVKTNNTHIVLAEEEYVDTLEKLIERNYFPDITKYKSELLLKEKQNRDNNEESSSQIGSSDFASPIGNAFSDLMSECDSIRKKNEDQSTMYHNNKNVLAFSNKNPFCFNKKKEEYQLVLLPNGKEHKINLHMSLKQFQNTYTSEDNKSFDYLLNKMKNLQIEKNVYSIEKRKKHNMLMDKIDEYTKKGINCHMLHTNKADKEELMMKFSSGQRISDILEVKRHKVDVNIDSTRFSKDDNDHIKKQVEGAEEIKQLRFLNKINEDKTEKMIAQGKFNLLKENNGFDYIKTPITESGNESSYPYSMKRGKHENSPLSVDSTSENDDDNDWNKNLDFKKRRRIDEEEEEIENHRSEFNLQRPSNRELVANRLQSSVKNVKYNKQALRNKYLKSVINKRFSSKMSTTSFKHSVLSKYSQKRLNELAQKSSLASQLLRNKESRP